MASREGEPCGMIDQDDGAQGFDSVKGVGFRDITTTRTSMSSRIESRHQAATSRELRLAMGRTLFVEERMGSGA